MISNRYDLDSIQDKTMTIEQAVIENLRELPPEKQQEVLDFIQSLKQKSLPKKPRRSLYGLWSDLGIEITDTDIAEARQEIMNMQIIW